MNLTEKSKVAIPGYTLAGMLLAWLLYLTHNLEAVKTDVAVIKATVLGAHASSAGADSAMAKSNK